MVTLVNLKCLQVTPKVVRIVLCYVFIYLKYLCKTFHQNDGQDGLCMPVISFPVETAISLSPNLFESDFYHNSYAQTV